MSTSSQPPAHPTDVGAPRVEARLEGVTGEAAPPPPGGEGTWQGPMPATAFVALLRAAATGQRLRYEDRDGPRDVRVRRCWYDAIDGRVRVRFTEPGPAA